jgi:N-acetylglutamate synthase-like GNAT family acetyltransferase
VIPHLPGDQVWSVTCYFVAPKARHQGLREGLLDAAYAADAGAQILEAYPSPNGKAYRLMGTRELYLKAGFTEVDASARPVMRKALLFRQPESRYRRRQQQQGAADPAQHRDP